MNAPVPPGWYPDPHMAGTQRFWDGGQWTAQAAPLAAPAPQSNAGLLVAGYLGALLIPIIGIVCGFLLWKRSAGNAAAILVLSAITALWWFDAFAPGVDYF